MSKKKLNKQPQVNNVKPMDAPSTSSEKQGGFRERLSLANLVVNSIKTAVLGKTQNQTDTVYETFGYKRELSYDDFYRAYKRQDIARRIIDATVNFTWKDFPLIVDDDASGQLKSIKPGTTLKELKNEVLKQNKLKVLKKKRIAMNSADLDGIKRANDEMAEIESVGVQYTAFEDAIWNLQAKLPILRTVKRADILNCIGRFSILVIGTNVASEDSRINDLKEELPKGTSIDEIIFLQPYSEDQVSISQWETNQTSPRYGLPKMYNIQVSGEGGTSINHQVHWSRVIHIAEDLLDSEVFGTPRLESVFNNLQDLLKIIGGSAEMFWLGAYQGLVFNIKDGYTLDDDSRNQMTEEIENYVNKLQRFMKTKGVEVTTLSSPVADPRGNFEVLIKLIAGASSVPERILLGTENGVYAGSTDQDTFFSYITSRRNGHAEETIIRPLIDRLVEFGFIPMPEGGDYYIKWPELFSQTQTEKLTNAKLMVDTVKAATPFGNTFDVITVEEVRTSVGLDAEIPETKYEQFAEEGDMLMYDEIDSLPNEDDTVDTENLSALDIYRARKGGSKDEG